MPQSEDNTSIQRVQLKHLLLDVDFYDKPKVKALAYKHGQLSVHLYVRWLTLMSRASNALVTRDAMGAIAQEVGFDEDKFSEILNYCVKTGMLSQSKDEEISNPRVLQDQLSCAVKRKEAKERQSKHRENKRVTNALPTRLPDPVSVTDPDLIDPNKNSQPPHLEEIKKPEIGLVRLGEYVRISEISQEQFITNCTNEGFTDKDQKEIIDALDRWYSKNLHAWREKDHFRDLMDWPFKKHREHKAVLARSRGDPKPPIKIAELKKQWIKEGRYKAS